VNLKKKSAGGDIQDGDLEAQGTTAKTREFAKNSPTLFSLLKPKKYSEPIQVSKLESQKIKITKFPAERLTVLLFAGWKTPTSLR
jgi:hypothetical protein